jgi:hypothetical protein
VRYTRAARPGHEARTCLGVVTKHYPGGERCWDEEAQVHYLIPDAVEVRVDKPLPNWWPYHGTDLFCPDVAEVEVIK